MQIGDYMTRLNSIEIPETVKQKYITDGFFILENLIQEDVLNQIRNECDYLVDGQNKLMDESGTDTLNLSRRNSRYCNRP